MAPAAILKFSLTTIIRSFWHIFDPNLTQWLKVWSWKQFCRQNLHPTKYKMAAAAIWKFCSNGHNSATISCICAKFDAEVHNAVQEAILKSKFTYGKIQDGGRIYFEIQLNCHNSVNFAHICTKFCKGTQNHVSETNLPSYLTRRNPRRRQPPFWNFILMAISRSLYCIYSHQIWHRGLKWSRGSSFTVKMYIRQNPRWRRPRY